MPDLPATYPPCPKCKNGVMLPLSGYVNSDNGDAIELRLATWMCATPDCGYAVNTYSDAVNSIPEKGTDQEAFEEQEDEDEDERR